jgi:hypothetical protein
MGNKELNTFDKIQLYLFSDPGSDKISLNPKELEIKKRCSAAFTFFIDNPSAPDKDVVNFLINEFQVSRPTAYDYVNKVHRMLGNIRNASKEWSRYLIIQENLEVIQNCKKIIALIFSKPSIKIKKDHQNKSIGFIVDPMGPNEETAELNENPEDPRLSEKNILAIIGLHNNIVKATNQIKEVQRLNKDEADRIEWEKLLPQDFEISTDITVIEGFSKSYSKEDIERIKRKYYKDSTEIQDAQLME